MLRWIQGVSLRDHKKWRDRGSSNSSADSNTPALLMQKRPCWYGHVSRSDDSHMTRTVMGGRRYREPRSMAEKRAHWVGRAFKVRRSNEEEEARIILFKYAGQNYNYAKRIWSLFSMKFIYWMEINALNAVDSVLSGLCHHCDCRVLFIARIVWHTSIYSSNNGCLRQCGMQLYNLASSWGTNLKCWDELYPGNERRRCQDAASD